MPALPEYGIPLRMIVVDYMGVEIDTPEDLQRAAKAADVETVALSPAERDNLLEG